MKIAWRVGKERHSLDLSGAGAAIAGGRWNDIDVPALYLGANASICCLEAFVNASGPPTVQMKLTEIELPDDPDLYLEPTDLPEGWNARPADRPSMAFGTQWLKSCSHLGLIVPSAVVPIERNLIINPRHPAASRIRVVAIHDFVYDPRMFAQRGQP